MIYLAGLGLAATLTVASMNVQAQRLGRLFSTTEERIRLEELRRERDIVAPDAQANAEPILDVPTVDQFSIDGLVIRSSGAHSVWINGRPVSGDARTREGVRVETSAAQGGRVKILLPSGADTVELKPGQKIDVDSGVVVEGYQRAPVSGAASVFDQVSSDDAPSSDAPSIPGTSPGAEGQDGAASRGIQYPEAFLERIRRALGGS